MPEAQFLEARKAFHAALLEATLTTNAAGVVSNADSSNTTSKAIAKGIADLLKAETIGERIAGQTSGNQFESICAGFVRETFLKLGHLRPGMFCVGGDSHSPSGGAFGTYMFGIGSTEMLGVVVTGEIWLRVPQTIAMHWSGRLAAGVCAKDMMLAMIARFGMNGADYQAVEFTGDAVRALSMQERMTLCNMSAELGAQTGLVAPDAVTWQWLRETGAAHGPESADGTDWASDPGSFDTQHDFDASALSP